MAVISSIIGALSTIGVALAPSVVGGAAAAGVSGTAVAAGIGALAVGGTVAAGAGVASALSKGESDAPTHYGATYNAQAEQEKADMKAAEANKKRALAETNTTRTSALGETASATTDKKTLLGQ